MSLMLFAEIHPQLALAETRTVLTKGYPGLPDDEYALLESYCPDPKCDCRRVMLHVNSRRGVVEGTDALCREHLNAECAQFSRNLPAAMARKRPSPLTRGKAQVWTCGIVYALGGVNFLWDKTQTPHMSSAELCQRFGVGQSTCSSRAKSIRGLFGVIQVDPRWCLSSKMDRNPLVWMLSVNGVLMDIRDAPRGAQEDALRKLIPHLPGTGGKQR